MKLLKANEATAAKRRVFFFVVDATDGITAETGETDGQPQVSTDGAAWTNAGISVLVALGNGHYYSELTQALVATAGPVVSTRYKSAATAEAPGTTVQVVAFDPDDVAALGLGRLDMPVSATFDATESLRGHHTAQKGTAIYVGPVLGNDTTGTGTRLLPYKTITKALSVAVDGTHTPIYVLADQASGPTVLLENITWNKRYTFLRGPGRDLIIRGVTANTPAISVTAAGAEFGGFQLESAATGANADGIEASGVDFLSMRHVFVNATQGTGVNLVNCSNARVFDCTFQGTGVNAAGHGLVMANSGTGNSRHNRVEGNKFYDVLGDSIRLTKAGSGVNENNCIGQNSIHGSTGAGVHVGAAVVDTQIHSNHFGLGNAGGDIVDNGTGTAAMNNEQWTKSSVWTNAKAAFVDASVAAVQADTDDLQTRIPATLVSGRMDASVGVMAANVVTAAALATDAVAEIQAGLSTFAGGAVASVTGAVGSVTGNVAGSVASVIGLTASDVGAIKAKTDNLPINPASQTNIDVPTSSRLAPIIPGRTISVEVNGAVTSTNNVVGTVLADNAAIATAVWDKATAAHVAAGSMGRAQTLSPDTLPATPVGGVAKEEP